MNSEFEQAVMLAIVDLIEKVLPAFKDAARFSLEDEESRQKIKKLYNDIIECLNEGYSRAELLTALTIVTAQAICTIKESFGREITNAILFKTGFISNHGIS